jgi:ATP-dependent RNA helicase DDX42
MDANDILKFRNELDISVIGNNIPDPIKTFEDAGFESFLLNNIKKLGFESPTPIQCQALPVALSGRDMIGLAKTGSGKTLSFIWPMIVHILDQPQMQIGIDGPIGIILAPTRELAAQIYSEAVKFCKLYNINVCAIFGGSGKWEMTKALKEAPEIVVATPGRFIDLIKAKATNLQRCTMIVLDEADRMFEMGFEYQMRSIVNNIRPDRQTLMFSATMKKKVEEFARHILTDPIRVVIDTIGKSNPDIQQVVEIFQDENQKLSWLYSHADEFIAEGKVLVFVSSKIGTETIAENLRNYFLQRQLAVGIECLHGDKDQNERTAAIKKFSKTEETAILVATDVASRGLDIKNIRTVINFEAPKNIETYVHRIGRTGRMGFEGIIPGVAFTL